MHRVIRKTQKQKQKSYQISNYYVVTCKSKNTINANLN